MISLVSAFVFFLLSTRFYIQHILSRLCINVALQALVQQVVLFHSSSETLSSTAQ